MAPVDPERSNPALSDVVVLCGSANPAIGAGTARELGLPLGGCTALRFPDGEVHVEVDARGIEGRDVFIVQPTPPELHAGSAADPAKGSRDHLLELLFLADACHRSGASSVSAVVPYFGYARQDRRKKPGEALGARVVAQVLGTARFERIVTVDLHSDVVEASLDVPAEALTAVPLLAEALRNEADRDSVVVAPDFGAVRLAREYSRLLGLPLAVVHKARASATQVDVEGVSGDVRGLHPIVVDDMIATGGTIVAAARALRDAGARGEMIVAATHPVLTPGTTDRLREAGLRRLVVTDTLALARTEPSIMVVSVAPLLAACIRRIAMRRSTVARERA